MFKKDRDTVLMRFAMAKKEFEAFGVDVQAAIDKFKTIPISIHNWLDDDVVGFEDVEGLHNENVVTGNYPGKARNGDDMRQDLEMVMKCCPAKFKLNLHTLYAEPSVKKGRNELDTEDFRNWIDWAKEHGCGIDMNVSYFTHPNMKNGFSLASPNKEIRDFWIECGKNSRKIQCRYRQRTWMRLRQQPLDPRRNEGCPCRQIWL